MPSPRPARRRRPPTGVDRCFEDDGDDTGIEGGTGMTGDAGSGSAVQ
ncbi:hypothetical protein ACQEVZ_55415 [Dactylosporangium sp. CA-152071]